MNGEVNEVNDVCSVTRWDRVRNKYMKASSLYSRKNRENRLIDDLLNVSEEK